jgi:hypothetical protein
MQFLVSGFQFLEPARLKRFSGDAPLTQRKKLRAES